MQERQTLLSAVKAQHCYLDAVFGRPGWQAAACRLGGRAGRRLGSCFVKSADTGLAACSCSSV
jgi:hypothetical protein